MLDSIEPTYYYMDQDDETLTLSSLVISEPNLTPLKAHSESPAYFVYHGTSTLQDKSSLTGF